MKVRLNRPWRQYHTGQTTHDLPKGVAQTMIDARIGVAADDNKAVKVAARKVSSHSRARSD